MSNAGTGYLWVPGFHNQIGIREDFTKVNFGGMELTISALSNVAGEAENFVAVAGKVLTVNKTLTLDGTDGTTMTFPATSATLARTDAANVFTGSQTMSSQLTATNLGTPGSLCVAE